MEDFEVSTLIKVGEQLKSLRKRHYPSDTQGIFAQRIGVSKNTYRHMENGTGNVSFSSYLKIAQLYGLEGGFLTLFEKSAKVDLFDSFKRPDK